MVFTMDERAIGPPSNVEITYNAAMVSTLEMGVYVPCDT
jgi:hypothetical protein